MTKIKYKEQGDFKGDIKVAITKGGKTKVPTKPINQTLTELKLTYTG